MAHCTDAFSRGWTHMIRLLFQPFRLVFWLKMAILALLLGGPSTFRFNFPGGGFPGSTPSPTIPGSEFETIMNQIVENIAIISVVFVAVTLFMIVFTFLHSCARFFFYDGILNGVVYFGDSWRRNSSQIIVYFLWNIVVSILFFILVIVLIALAFLVLGGILGFSSTEPTMGVIILMVTLGLGFALILILLGILYAELLDGVVVPHMLVKKIGIFESWSIALRLFFENLLEFVGFLLIRLAVGIVSFMFYFFAAMIIGVMAMLVMFPIFGLASPDSNLPFVFMTVMTLVLILPGVYIVNFIFLPISVFNNAYSLSFLAGIAHDPTFEPQNSTTPITQPSPGIHPLYTGPAPTPPHGSDSASDRRRPHFISRYSRTYFAIASRDPHGYYPICPPNESTNGPGSGYIRQCHFG